MTISSLVVSIKSGVRMMYVHVCKTYVWFWRSKMGGINFKEKKFKFKKEKLDKLETCFKKHVPHLCELHQLDVIV